MKIFGYRSKTSKSFDLEEAIYAGKSDPVELPLSASAIRLLLVISFFVFIISFGRIAYLSLYRGNFYTNRAIANANLIHTIEAGRGIIFDRYGTPLVKNIPSFKLVLHIPQFLRSTFTEQENIVKSLASSGVVSESVFYDTIYGVDLEKVSEVLLARQLKREQIIKLSEIGHKSLTIEEDYTREYIDGEQFSAILGYVGLVTKEDLRKTNKLSLNDYIGKAGLEFQYDEILGKPFVWVEKFDLNLCQCLITTKGALCASKRAYTSITNQTIELNSNYCIRAPLSTFLRVLFLPQHFWCPLCLLLNSQDLFLFLLVMIEQYKTKELTQLDIRQFIDV